MKLYITLYFIFALNSIFAQTDGIKGYDGKFMLPSQIYDYSINGSIENKFTDDWKYIVHGQTGIALSRYFELLYRDYSATSVSQKIDFGITVSSSFLPFIKIGNLKIPLKGFTSHGLQQAITRGFTSKDILKIIREGSAVITRGRYGSQIRYTLNGNTVVINTTGNNAGKIVTIYSTQTGTRYGINQGKLIPLE